jgi:hypothetical protein
MATTQPKSTSEAIYQVELHVERAFKDDVLAWLEKVSSEKASKSNLICVKEHIADMLELENNSIFYMAEILEPVEEDPAAQTHTIVVQYRAASNERVQHYFKTHAEALRKKVQGKSIEGKFTASRKVLKQRSYLKGMPQTDTFGYVF